jgi:hypothetical protein
MPQDDRAGAKLVTCAEASRMLREGRAVRAEFRPADYWANKGKYSDNDPAFVWEE